VGQEVQEPQLHRVTGREVGHVVERRPEGALAPQEVADLEVVQVVARVPACAIHVGAIHEDGDAVLALHEHRRRRHHPGRGRFHRGNRRSSRRNRRLGCDDDARWRLGLEDRRGLLRGLREALKGNRDRVQWMVLELDEPLLATPDLRDRIVVDEHNLATGKPGHLPAVGLLVEREGRLVHAAVGVHSCRPRNQSRTLQSNPLNQFLSPVPLRACCPGAGWL
jgi:hypothetical protein